MTGPSTAALCICNTMIINKMGGIGNNNVWKSYIQGKKGQRKLKIAILSGKLKNYQKKYEFCKTARKKINPIKSVTYKNIYSNKLESVRGKNAIHNSKKYHKYENLCGKRYSIFLKTQIRNNPYCQNAIF